MSRRVRGMLMLGIAVVGVGALVGIARYRCHIQGPQISRVTVGQAVHVERIAVTMTGLCGLFRRREISVYSEEGARIVGPVRIEGWWLEKVGVVGGDVKLEAGTYYLYNCSSGDVR